VVVVVIVFVVVLVVLATDGYDSVIIMKPVANNNNLLQKSYSVYIKYHSKQGEKIVVLVRILMSKSGFEDEVLIKLIVGVVKHVTIDKLGLVDYQDSNRFL
jgi:hypothetical protein